MISLNKPKISIVISVRNGVQTFQKCLDSIRAQTYRGFELIVIDGNSNDGTLDIIKKNTDLINYWTSASDSGIYEAWNKGLLHCEGDWIYFLGADDFLWKPDVLNDVSNNLSTLPADILIAYGQVFLIDSEGSLLQPSGKPWISVRKLFMEMMSLPHQGVFHKAELFSRFGKFNDSFKIAGDYEMLLRYLKSNTPIFLPNLIVAGVQLGGASNNSKNLLIVMKEFRLARKINAISGYSLFWVFALFKVYLRIFLYRLIGEKKINKIINYLKKLIFSWEIKKDFL